MRLRVVCCTVLAALLLAGPSGAHASELPPSLAHARTVVGAKALATHSSVASTKAPFYTSGTSWALTDLTRWNSGFLGGLLWSEYQRTGSSAALAAARARTATLASRASDKSTMDVGFILAASFGEGYRLTGDPAYRAVLLQGAGSLASRYQPVVGAIRSRSNSEGLWTSTDTMMNIPLLFWASRNGGSRSWYDMAMSQSALTARDFIRADGSTYHYVLYNEKSGAVMRKGTAQGASDTSTWSRGQAWVIYGMATAYDESADTRFLDAAHRTTAYWRDHVPADGVPYWDFDAPGIPAAPRDSSAAAAAASAFVKLSRLDPDAGWRAEYERLAAMTLSGLASAGYLSEDAAFPAALMHGTFNMPSGLYDHGTIWGDYYFAEALARLRTQVVRLGGRDRYSVAVRTSQQTFPAATSAIVVSGEGFADAMAASSLAGIRNAPILLTRPGALPAAVAEELRRLGVRRVVVVGGTRSVAPAVVSAISSMGIGVARLGGADRYETAALVARQVAAEKGASFGGEYLLVRGDVYTDALSVSPVAYAAMRPVLLTRPGALPGATAAVLSGVSTRGVTVVGGTASVSPAVAAASGRAGRCAVARVSGPDRYATAVAVADWACARGFLGSDTVGVATGLNFPDALAGGAAMGARRGVLLMTAPGALNAATAAFVGGHAGASTEAFVFGGESSVAPWTENQLRIALPEQ